MEKLSLKAGGESEVPNLAAILTQGSQYKLKHNDTVWDEGWSEQEVRDYLKASTPYLITLEGKEVGAVWLQWEDEHLWGSQEPVAGYMHRLVIKDGFHGKDIGAKVIDEVSRLVEEKGRQFLRLDCPAANTGLCNYYESLGFNKVDEKPVPEYGYTEALYERAVGQKD